MKAGAILSQRLRAELGSTELEVICKHYKILFCHRKLADGIKGFTYPRNGHKVIVVNATLPQDEQREVAYHELYHLLMSVPQLTDPYMIRRDEHNADVFAALCMAPEVSSMDDINTVMGKHGMTWRLARLRLVYEAQRYLVPAALFCITLGQWLGDLFDDWL